MPKVKRRKRNFKKDRYIYIIGKMQCMLTSYVIFSEMFGIMLCKIFRYEDDA